MDPLTTLKVGLSDWFLMLIFLSRCLSLKQHIDNPMNIMLSSYEASTDYVFYRLKKRMYTFYENISTITEVTLGKKSSY